jgi:hypothetical protein
LDPARHAGWRLCAYQDGHVQNSCSGAHYLIKNPVSIIRQVVERIRPTGTFRTGEGGPEKGFSGSRTFPYAGARFCFGGWECFAEWRASARRGASGSRQGGASWRSRAAESHAMSGQPPPAAQDVIGGGAPPKRQPSLLGTGKSRRSAAASEDMVGGPWLLPLFSG